MSDAAQGYPGAVAAMQRGGPAFSAGSGRGGGGGGRGGGGGGRGGGTAPRKAAPNVGGKTLKLKNNFRLHKQSLKLEAVEEGAKQELHFTFDAEIAGEAQIFWDCVDMTFPEVLKDPQQLQKVGLDLQREKASSKPKWFKFPVSRSSFASSVLALQRKYQKYATETSARSVSICLTYDHTCVWQYTVVY
jgi:hypothetical protein